MPAAGRSTGCRLFLLPHDYNLEGVSAQRAHQALGVSGGQAAATADAASDANDAFGWGIDAALMASGDPDHLCCLECVRLVDVQVTIAASTAEVERLPGQKRWMVQPDTKWVLYAAYISCRAASDRTTMYAMVVAHPLGAS